MGPNCVGVACGKSHFCSIPDETLQELKESPVAVVAQSGAICASLNRAINELGLKVAYFASCGGQIGCTISDFIDYFAVQPELKVILCYIDAVSGLLFGVIATSVLLALIVIIGLAAGGFGIANEKKWGYAVAVGGAVVQVIMLFAVFGSDVLTSSAIINLLFDGALVALLLHPMSRDYQRIWFK